MTAWIVALTGGIASGKSEVASRFAALGADVIDADVVARELVVPSAPLLAEIAATFGTDVLARNGTLDRAALRRRVFADPDLRRRLEAILHPAIWRELQLRAAQTSAAYVLLVIPLLVESGLHQHADRVLLVDVPRETQVRRLILRDRIATDLANAMLAAQATREERLAAADDVLDNSGTPTALDAQVARLHLRYLEFAREKHATPHAP